MVHAVIPPPRCTAATLELTHKGTINDKTITERDREVRDFENEPIWPDLSAGHRVLVSEALLQPKKYFQRNRPLPYLK